MFELPSAHIDDNYHNGNHHEENAAAHDMFFERIRVISGIAVVADEEMHHLGIQFVHKKFCIAELAA